MKLNITVIHFVLIYSFPVFSQANGDWCITENLYLNRKLANMESVQLTEWWHLASSLQKRGFNSEEISSQLRDKGAPENLLSDIITKVKDLHFTRKRNTGFVCCGIGVFLLIAGCMLTFVLYSSGDNIRYAMYGMTTVGVVFSLKGLADIMGW